MAKSGGVTTIQPKEEQYCVDGALSMRLVKELELVKTRLSSCTKHVSRFSNNSLFQLHLEIRSRTFYHSVVSVYLLWLTILSLSTTKCKGVCLARQFPSLKSFLAQSSLSAVLVYLLFPFPPEAFCPLPPPDPPELFPTLEPPKPAAFVLRSPADCARAANPPELMSWPPLAWYRSVSVDFESYRPRGLLDRTGYDPHQIWTFHLTAL